MSANDIELSQLAAEFRDKNNQLRILHLLRQEEMYISQIARALDLNRSTVFRWLEKWESLDIVSSRTGRLDKRRKYFQLTMKGTNLAETLAKEV